MNRAFRNRAEPWMAEPSVQGRIYSVFLKALFAAPWQDQWPA
ncbi:hypothetical protein D777_02868 [Marinobacter nitratireducens]|uniref:Uncharacterized protein n=1 Tax=Marinobacter nitratireducens TaxID=1137280 RepID=A0A072N070_9GAMM|nr:hypothetical protein D777_02868 [Marinobacter nitratireducens]